MSLYLSPCSRSLNWTELDKMCTLMMKSMKFVSSVWPEQSASQVMVCKGANIFFVFLSLCVLSRKFLFFTPTFGLKMWKQPCRWVLSFTEVLWQEKSVSDPFHLSRTYFRMKHAPALGSFFYFFCPKDTWAHAAWLPAWTRRRRSCRHSSGAWHHHQPISCWNVDLEHVEVMPVQQNIRSVGRQQSSPWMWWKSWFKR